MILADNCVFLLLSAYAINMQVQLTSVTPVPLNASAELLQADYTETIAVRGK